MTYLLAISAALLIGISKGGLKGISPIFILLMAEAYGGKTSTGIIVPLLLLGDIFAAFFYKRHIQKKYVLAFLPWMIIGILIGVWLGKDLSEESFKKGIAFLILASLLLLWLSDLYFKKVLKPGIAVSSITGIGAGIFTMLGNFAGPFSNLYFLMTRIPKKEIIGTTTLIFFIVNLFKIPFHIFSWETISWETLSINAYLSPAVIIGFFIGMKIVNMISEKWFRQFLYVVTLLGALIVLFK